MIFACNLKCNHTRASFKKYAENLGEFYKTSSKDDEIIVFPPSSAFLENLNFTQGAQNFYPAKNGAFTGEIGAEMLDEFNIKCVMIGHSERRALGENDALLKAKFDFAKEQGWRVIYCVGEDDIVHMNNNTCEVLAEQLGCIDTYYEHLIVAYEPIWAIGTGKSAKVETIAKILNFLASKTVAPLLYGGSVNAANIAEITSISRCSGVLIGSASWKVENLIELIKAC